MNVWQMELWDPSYDIVERLESDSNFSKSSNIS